MNKTKKIIAKRNAEFEAASPEQKRILILKDMKKWLKAGRFVPTSGTFVTFDYYEATDLLDNEDIQQAFLSKKLAECAVCLVGAVCLSTILYVDSFKGKDLHHDTDIFCPPNKGNKASKILRTYFSLNQLRLMELAFEIGDGWFRKAKTIEEKAAVEFGTKYYSDQDRILAIINNMLKNSGIFKP